MSKLDKLKTLIPMEEIELGALNQIYKEIERDFLKELRIMPDVHQGYTLPIGGVALLDGVISPDYVGSDIGCGMCHINTGIKTENYDERLGRHWYQKIPSVVPIGVGGKRSGKHRYYDIPVFESAIGDRGLDKSINERLGGALGTLGGGNHFISIGDYYGDITVTLHSGSRGIGYELAGYYMELAKKEDKDLPEGFFRLDSKFGQAYLKDMNFMLDYALENRKLMLFGIAEVMGFNLKNNNTFINETHNHALVTPEGVLHRKGATEANEGQIGIIPINMRDGVFVTEGLGNEEFLNSSSHGAGRVMSRNKAKKTINLETFKEQMNGIICNDSQNNLDEAPDAYKDYKTVIGYQDGINIKVLGKTTPLVVLS